MRVLLHAVSVLVVGCGTTVLLASDAEFVAAPEHFRFWDRPQIVATSVSFSLATVDVAQTCSGLSKGRRELTLPTQSCGPALGWIYGGQIGQNLLAYELRKHGHPRLGRAIPWMAASGSVFAISYSFTH